jgi:hypothetical protein
MEWSLRNQKISLDRAHTGAARRLRAAASAAIGSTGRNEHQAMGEAHATRADERHPDGSHHKNVLEKTDNRAAAVLLPTKKLGSGPVANIASTT